MLDKKKHSLILPIEGRLVPFSLTVLKNVSKSDEDKYLSLRFNFHTPASYS